MLGCACLALALVATSVWGSPGGATDRRVDELARHVVSGGPPKDGIPPIALLGLLAAISLYLRRMRSAAEAPEDRERTTLANIRTGTSAGFPIIAAPTISIIAKMTPAMSPAVTPSPTKRRFTPAMTFSLALLAPLRCGRRGVRDYAPPPPARTVAFGAGQGALSTARVPPRFVNGASDRMPVARRFHRAPRARPSMRDAHDRSPRASARRCDRRAPR